MISKVKVKKAWSKSIEDILRVERAFDWTTPQTLDHSIILPEKVSSLFVLAALMAQNTCIINIQWSCNPWEIQGYKNKVTRTITGFDAVLCYKDRAPRAQEALPVSSCEIFPLMAVKCVTATEKYLSPELWPQRECMCFWMVLRIKVPVVYFQANSFCESQIKTSFWT